MVLLIRCTSRVIKTNKTKTKKLKNMREHMKISKQKEIMAKIKINKDLKMSKRMMIGKEENKIKITDLEMKETMVETGMKKARV